ncbi:MAG TPA: poly-gamma-glutamate hydrolase family protein [Iamia sp.]
MDLEELLALPGTTEHVELGSRFGFMAYHGGRLEEMTDVVASMAATLAGASYYGILTPADAPHLPSTAFRPDGSPALARFLDHVEVVITVHGYGREGMWTSLLAGGSNRDLARHVAEHLRPALPGYEVLDDLDAIPDGLRGLHPDNPVNVPPGGGVQLELPPRVRGTSPLSPPADRDGLSAPTRALSVALAKAAATWDLSPA